MSGLAEFISQLSAAFDAKRRHRQRVHSDLVRARFEALREANQTFWEILRELRRALRQLRASIEEAPSSSQASVDVFERAVEQADTRRDAGRSDRRALYEEASRIFNAPDLGFSSIISIMSKQELDLLRSFAKSLKSYFEFSEGYYQHDLAEVLKFCGYQLDLVHKSAKRGRLDRIERAIGRIEKRLDHAEASLEEKWAECASRYALLEVRLGYDLDLSAGG